MQNNQRGSRRLRSRTARKNYNEEESDSEFEDSLGDVEETKKSSQENKNENQGGKRSAGRVVQELSESEEIDQDVTVPD